MALPANRRGAAAGATNGPYGPRVLAHQQAYLPAQNVLLCEQTTSMLHYDVDSDFVLHSNCRCSENVDVATNKVWPVVIMCRRCSPFPERLIGGDSQAHN